MSDGGYVISVDPAHLAKQFSVPANFEFFDEVEPEAPDNSFDQSHRDKLSRLISELDPREQDILNLQLKGKRQQDIGKLFGITQAAVGYILVRARQRLKWLRNYGHFDEELFRKQIAPYLTGRTITPDNIETILMHYRTTNQSKTAKSLGMTQSAVRSRIYTTVTALKRIAKRNPELEHNFKCLTVLTEKQSQNIRSAVILPQWRNRKLSDSVEHGYRCT